MKQEVGKKGEERRKGWVRGKRSREKVRECSDKCYRQEHHQRNCKQPRLCSGQALTTDCPFTDLNPKRSVYLRSPYQNIKIVLTLFFTLIHFLSPCVTLRAPDVVKPPSVTVEICSLWKSADWFDKMLGLLTGNGFPSVALCIGYQQVPGNTGLNLLKAWLTLL